MLLVLIFLELCSFFPLLTSNLSNPLQVGDVILVHDETVMENEFRMAGLETLVHFFVFKRRKSSFGNDTACLSR